jgi:hypothetical protein
VVEDLATAPAPWLLAFFIVSAATAFARNWVYLRREYRALEKDNERLEREKDEYKLMAFKAVGLGERLADVARESKQ